MADKESLLHEKEQSLNFLSESFDPLKALYTKDLKTPIPNIQVFNNLGEYARVIKEGRPKTAPQKQPRKTPTLANKRTRNLKPEYKPPDISTRLKVIASTRVAQRDLLSSEKRVGISGQDDDGFSKDQKANALGFGRGQTRKKRYMNVLEKMDACATGPLSILYKCLDKRYKVQVWIRKYKGLRSVLTGYVIAFDKHMNLALMDVDEVYTTEEHLRNECSTEEEKTTKKKKKKKKRPKTQINRSLMDSNKEENVSVGITPMLDKIHEKSLAGSKENPRPLLNEGTKTNKTDEKYVTELKDISVSSSNGHTTEQNVETGLTEVVDLNRPFKSFQSDYSRKETVIKSKEDTESAKLKGGASSSLVMAKECDKTEMLSIEQLAVLSKQWEDQHEVESKQTSDSQQEIETVGLTEQPIDKGSEQTGYFFSHDLKVRVPAYEDSESQDMEFTVVGIFQPASTVESSQNKSVMLPENLEINVPLSFSNSINKEVIQDHIIKLDKLVIPDTEFDLYDADKAKELNAHSLQADNPVLAVSEAGDSDNKLVIQLEKPVLQFSEPVLQDTSVDYNLANKIVQTDKPILPVSESILHGISTDVDLEIQAIKLDKPEVLVSELVLHGQDAAEEAKDKIVQSDNVDKHMEGSFSNIDVDGISAEDLSADTPATDKKSLICEGSSKEGKLLHEHKAEALPAASCNIDKNSVISERNTKEREVSQEISTLNTENPNIESFKSGKFGIDENEMRSENVLKESDAGVEFQEDGESTCLSEGLRSTEQKETEGGLLKEDENKNDEKCPTSSENDNICNDDGMKYKEESENIENLNQGIGYVDLEEGEIEQEDSKTSTDSSGGMMASREQNKSKDNELAGLSKKDAVEESAVQDGLDGSMKEHKEATKHKSLSGERKAVAESVCKATGDSICCSIAGSGLEESSLFKSLSADGMNNSARDEWLLTKSKGSMIEKPILEEKSENGRSQSDGNEKRTEDTRKNTPQTSEGVVKGAQKAEEENAMGSEKEEGEITSSDEGEPDQSIQSQVDLPKHVDTINQQKISVWERLGFKDRNKKEESARRGSGENYDKQKQEEKKQKTERNKDVEKKTKDRRQSTSGDNKRKEQSGRNKEGKEKRDGSSKTVRKDKVTWIKRGDLITGREMHSGRKGEKEKDDTKKKEQSGVSHLAKKKAGTTSHNTDHTRQSRKDKENSVNEKAKEGRSSSHEKEGQRKEGRQPSRAMSRSDIPAPHSDKEDTQSRKGKKETKSPSTEMKKNEGEQRGWSSGDEKHPGQSKEGKPDRGKVDKVMKSEDKRDSKERTTKPLSDHDSENGSRNMPHGTKAGESLDKNQKKESAVTSTRKLEPLRSDHDSKNGSRNLPHGTKARRESIDRNERKGSASTSTKTSEPSGDHDSEKGSGSGRNGIQTRREGIDRSERKRSASTSSKKSEPSGDRDSEKGSRSGRNGIQTRREGIDRSERKRSATSSKNSEPLGDHDSEKGSRSGRNGIQTRRESIDRSEGKRSATSSKNSEPSGDHDSEKGSRSGRNGIQTRRESTDRSERKRSASTSSKTSEPSGDHDSEKGSRSGRNGIQTRRESTDRSERKRSASTSSKTSEPSGDHDSEKGSRSGRNGIQTRREGIDRSERKRSATSSKNSEPLGDHDSEKGSRSGRNGIQTRREGIDRSERKRSATSSKNSEPLGDHDSEKGSRSARCDIQTRRESIERKYKKESGAAVTSRSKAKPQGDQPKHMHSSDAAKQLILKEFSTSHHKPKEIPKVEKTGKMSKPEHHLTALNKPRNPKSEGSDDECHEGKHLPNKRSDKNTNVNKAQEAQSEEPSTGSKLMNAKSGGKVEEMKKSNANRLGTSELDTSSERTSAGENVKPWENPKTEKTEPKPKKVGLLPTPVLKINTRMQSGSNPNCQNTSSRIIRNETQVQKSPETYKKRKISIESGMGGRVKRQKRMETSEESISKSSNQLTLFKHSRKKDKSNSETKVKSPKSRGAKKDIGGEGSATIGTPRQIMLGKGKFLEFKRRHVNQLFVRGDNIVMIGYAIL